MDILIENLGSLMGQLIKFSLRNFLAAFGAGIVGAIAMTAVMTVVRAMDLTQLNLVMMLGSILTKTLDNRTAILGFSLQLLNGGIFALFYAFCFYWLKMASFTLGMGIGFIHWAMAGILLGIVPSIHPLIPEQLPAPGFFAAYGGPFDIILLLAIHLLYGGIVGYIYSRFY